MSETVEELFNRFISIFPKGNDAVLQAERFQEGSTAQAAKKAIFTILVHGRHSGSDEPLAIILMTVPQVAADDPVILEFATRRARAHKAPYFVTWTLRDTILWCTPKPGTPYSRDTLEKLRDYTDIYEIGASDQQVLSEPIKLKILDRGHEILQDLEHLVKDEALELVQIDSTYFVGRLLDSVHRLLPTVTISLHERLNRDIHFRDEITSWAVKQSIAGAASDSEFANSIARQIIYRLLGKVLFYKSLRRSARQLPKLDLRKVDSAQVLPTLRTYFAQALKIDYHAVFEEDVPDRVKWPSSASIELTSLINDFNTRDFDRLPQDVVGTVFERLIPPEERHGLGQYFTSENLCDLITAFCIRSPDDKVLDPTCGTGTFLIRTYDRLQWQGKHDHTSMLSQLWGIDIAPFPAELATINLFRQRIAEYGNFPRIICRDFFRVSLGDHFPFPPPKMNMEKPEMIEEPIPLFDAIIGNFPYISADQIEKQEANYLELLRERLIKDWFDIYPQLFYYKKKKQQREFERYIAAGKHTDCERDSLQHRISTYADMYVHLFFHAACFLKPGGRMGIVTSNAWLDVNYGHELQEFFLRHFKIVSILESRCEPWFTEASVNTVVTILERCDEPAERDSHLVKFVKVKKPLDELIAVDLVIDATARWEKLRDLITHVERAGVKYTKTFPMDLITEENDNFRIRILRQGEMREEIESEGKTVKWGRYLRAPQVFFDLLGHGKLCLLSEIATPKRGGLTRINEFFHVSYEVAEQFGIEDEYLIPLIKSPKETNTITVAPSDLKLRVFVCRRTKSELKKLGHKGALQYIEWGEKETYSKGKFKGMPWPDGTWLKDRQPGWWALPPTETHFGQIFFSMFYADSHIHRFCPVKLVPDNTLYYLEPISEIKYEELTACLNSFLVALNCEVTGRVALGDGVLALKVEDARDYLLLPDIRRMNRANLDNISRTLEPLLKREIGTVYEEVRQEDRKELDKVVLQAVGLDPKKYLKPLYNGLCELVRERIELGIMRGKIRKTRVRGDRAEKRVAGEVLDEILPQGPKRFPDEFFSASAASGPKKTVELPDEPLVFEYTPMFMGVHVEGGSFNYDVKSPAEGNFLVYAQQAGHKVAYLPKETVEITRTVANYEKELRELRKRLYDAYYRRTLDTKAAARLTQAAFNRFHLPKVEN